MRTEEKKAPKGTISPELVAKARAGDQAAFSALYEQTHLVLYRSVRSMVHDEDLAWDILQDSYLRAYQSLDKLEADEAFLPWLRRIAVNEAARQAAKRLPMSFSDLAGGDEGEEDREPVIPDLRIESQPELALDRKETSRLVREILAGLPDQQQLIVGMHYYEDMPIKEIAELLNLAPGTVKAQLFRGRRYVETRVRELEQQGVKLYGMGPIPFLVALLRGLEPARSAEQKALAAVLAHAPAAGCVTAGAAVTGRAAAAVGETAVNMTVMTAGQAFLHGLAVKILSGVLAVALIGGGIWAGSKLLKDRQSSLNSLTSEPQVFSTESPVVPTQPVGSEEETHPPQELTGNECGAEGANLTWSFDPATGTLTIEGSGAMADFINYAADDSESTMPWFRYSESITKVSLPDGLSYIGSGAFQNCERLDKVSIPSEVTRIGENAFYGCPLDSVTIPASVSTIGDNAFTYCSGMIAISVAPDNPAYSSDENGVLYNKNQTVLIQFPCGYQGDYAVPDGVTTIGNSAFLRCADLRSVTIPASVTTIGDHAFLYCGDLTGFFVAPDNPVYSSDENGVLFNKERTVLIQLPAAYQGDYTIPASVTSIGESAFSGCSSLSSVTIPEGVSSIGDSAFSHCYSLSSVIIPEGVTSIGEKVFYRCRSLISATIPEGVTSIGDSTFYECSNLKTITIPSSVTFIGESAFSACGLSSVTIPEGVSFIGDSAFSECYSLNSAAIPEGVSSIGDSAFSNCSSLTSVTLPEGVTSIGEYAFDGCSSLSSVTLPEGVASIGEYAFFDCSSLNTVTIPSSVTTIGAYAFASCASLTGIYVAPDNPAYSSDEHGVLFNKVQTVLIEFPNGFEGDYNIPQGVTSIGDQAFSDCYDLTSVTIPEGVSSIGERAFYGCHGVNAITIPSSATSIGKSAFSFCGLSSVAIPEGVSSIGESAFSNCSSLNTVTISSSVTTIGAYAFASCDSLTGIYVAPDNPAYSSDEHGILFNREQTVLIKFTSSYEGDYIIPQGVTSIGDYAFSECRGLRSVTIPTGVTSLGACSFQFCSGLTSVTIPDSVTSIGDCAFYYCHGLKTVNIPESVTSIGEYAFKHCSGLTSVTIPDSVTFVGFGAFDECSGLTSVHISESVTSIGTYTFCSCTGLTSVMIPESVTSIGEYAFEDCSALTTAAIPQGVTSIGYGAFLYCDELMSVTIPDSVTAIGITAFAYCPKLTSITIPASVTNIGEEAFYGCPELTIRGVAGSVAEQFAEENGIPFEAIP